MFKKKNYVVGKEWKWEHTKSGQPLGPHGLWMTKDFAVHYDDVFEIL